MDDSSNSECFSNLLCIKITQSPNMTADTMRTLFVIPSTVNEIRMRMVEMINPEFRMTLWKWSVWKNEKSSRNTSVIMRILKNSSKKILLTFFSELRSDASGSMMPELQLMREYTDMQKSKGTNAIAIHFFTWTKRWIRCNVSGGVFDESCFFECEIWNK